MLSLSLLSSLLGFMIMRVFFLDSLVSAAPSFSGGISEPKLFWSEFSDLFVCSGNFGHDRAIITPPRGPKDLKQINLEKQYRKYQAFSTDWNFQSGMVLSI